MAYVSNMVSDDEQKNPAQGAVPPSGGAGVQLAPSSGIGSVGSPTTQPGQPGAGGAFATLDKYLTANQGQAEPLANKLTQGIGQQYNTLAGQNASTLGDIGGQVTAGSVPSNAGDVLAQEAANPVSFTGNQGNVKQFQGLLNATYGGPTSAEGTPGFTAQQNAINNAIAQGTQQTTTEAGREQLLSQNEAAPSTSVTGLNSAILSQSPTALNQVESAYQPFSNLLTGLSTGAQGIDRSISQAQGNTAATNAAANKQISDQIAALNTNVNTEYGNLQNKYQAANTEASNLASGLQGGTLPSGYGIDPGLQAFINSNINPWMTANAPGQTISYNFANAVPAFTTNPAPTIQQAATAQDYAQAQAFQNLLAGLNTGIAAPIINPATASQAGTYNIAALPQVNNQLLAGDIAGGLQAVPANVSAGPFNQYLALLAALAKYQGQPIGLNAPGPGTPIPTIA